MSKRTRIILILVAAAIVGIWIAVWISLHPSWIGEQPGTADYVHKTIGLFTDLPHATVEMVYSQIDNLLSWLVVAFIVRRYVDRKMAAEHKRLDDEHGYDHDEHVDK